MANALNMLHYLLELRRRALYSVLWFITLFVLFFFAANDLFHLLVMPLLHALPSGQELIATKVTSPILTPLQLAGDAAMVLSAPFALYQLWHFVAPALYKDEQKQIRGAIMLSISLFFLGVVFCFYLVLPYMFHFFAEALPKGVHFMPDMADAVHFITRMLLLFGICFQVPLLCLVLARLELINLVMLKKIRPYVIVGAFIIGMLLTPPDVLSQIMLALPLCLLYELGIIFVLYLV